MVSDATARSIRRRATDAAAATVDDGDGDNETYDETLPSRGVGGSQRQFALHDTSDAHVPARQRSRTKCRVLEEKVVGE